MTSIVERVELPGVGVRTVFSTNSGIDVGVLDHNSGIREVLVYSQIDPDQCASVVKLDPGEAQAMADLLGVIPTPPDNTLHIGSLVVKSAVVGAKSPMHGRSLSRTETGVTVMGVVRNDQLLPTPDALLEPADVVLVAGSADAVATAVELLESGP